jgi:hypothetical protein
VAVIVHPCEVSSFPAEQKSIKNLGIKKFRCREKTISILNSRKKQARYYPSENSINFLFNITLLKEMKLILY